MSTYRVEIPTKIFRHFNFMLIFNPSDRHMWDTKDDQLIAEKSVIKPYIIYAFQSDLNIS